VIKRRKKIGQALCSRSRQSAKKKEGMCIKPLLKKSATQSRIVSRVKRKKNCCALIKYRRRSREASSRNALGARSEKKPSLGKKKRGDFVENKERRKRKGAVRKPAKTEREGIGCRRWTAKNESIRHVGVGNYGNLNSGTSHKNKMGILPSCAARQT